MAWTLVSGATPVVQTGNGVQILQIPDASRRGESVNNSARFPGLYIDSQHVLYRLEFTS